MEWFIEVFLPSFNMGETQITEKQFDIFMKYLTKDCGFGYTSGKQDVVNGLKVRAYEWACITGKRFYVDIEIVEE